jgi:hypothetical protein
MTLGTLSLGAVDPVWSKSFSGFDYPNTAQLLPVLGDGTSARNAVLQQSAPTVRQGSLACTLETADMLTIRGYYESREAVVFTDADGSVNTCRVFDFTRTFGDPDWDVTIVLLETDAVAEGPGVGFPVAGLDTMLAADPAAGAVNLKVASVTTVAAGQFVRVAAAGVAATALNSEVVLAITVGTTGSGGTGLGIESDTGGGMVLDRASADEVKTVTGTLLAAPAGTGATTVRVDSVTNLAIGTVLRIGYLGRYERRALTAVGTAGPSGTGVSFTAPLLFAHGHNEWAVVVVP